MNKSKVIKLLKYKNIEQIGSSTDHFIKYPSDIDLQDIVKTDDTYSDIYSFFMKIFEKAHKNDDLFILDFKCGFYKGKPIKWTYKDMKRGYKEQNNLQLSFKFALTHENSMIKLDIVSVDENKLFTEYSVNYYFYYNQYRFTNFKLNDALIETRLEYDYSQLMKNNKLYKALKRLYSISKLKKDKKTLKQLEHFFNSPLGELYKQKSNLETIDNVIHNITRKPSLNLIHHNLNEIKKHLPDIFHKNIDKILKLKNLNSISVNINDFVNVLDEHINNKTNEWITKTEIKKNI